MPAVDDIAGKQRPGLAPVGAVVVEHRSLGQSLRGDAPVALARRDRSPRHRADRSRSRCGFTPSSTRSTSSALVLSPQISRWLPSSQRSPGTLTGCSGTSGTSSGSVRPGVPRLVSASDLQLAEAGQRQVEAEALQLAELEAEQLVVPAGVQRQLVVGNDQRPLLRLAQAGKLDDRHRRHAELPRRQQPPVPGDDAVVAVDQDRVGPAELADRGGDLRHLRVRVRARVLRKRDQSRGRTVFHRESSIAQRDVITRVHSRRRSRRHGRSFAIIGDLRIFPATSNSTREI